MLFDSRFGWLPVLSDRLRRKLCCRSDRSGVEPDRPVPGACWGGRGRSAYPLCDRYAYARGSLLRPPASSPAASMYHRPCTRPALLPLSTCGLGDGESIVLGKLRINVDAHTRPTRDSMCLHVENRTLQRRHSPDRRHGKERTCRQGTPEALHDSLFNRGPQLDPALEVYPAHE